MILAATAQQHHDPSNILKIYKAWKCQRVNFDFIFGDFNDEKLKLPIDICHIHKPYQAVFNLPFMINATVREGLKDNIKYIQLLGDDCFPYNDDYLAVCLNLIQDYDIIIPKLIRLREANDALGDFETTSDLTYQTMVEVARGTWQKLPSQGINEGVIFARREVFEKLHGYDETFMLWGWEEKDFIERAKQFGFKIYELEYPFLIHPYHPREHQNSEEAIINKTIYNLTLQKKLPVVRMPNDWGLANEPRPNTDLINEVKKRKMII